MEPTDIIAIRDETSGATARILPALGFNCFSFQVEIDEEPLELLWSEPDFGPGSRPSRSGIPILFPFGGRLRGTTYTWQGVTYEVTGAQLNDGNAIHGFVINRPWRVVDQAAHAVVAEFQASVDDPSLLSQWPADFRVRLSYTVSGASLRSSIEIENPDDKPLPFTFATHPYFRLPLGPEGAVAECRVTVPAAERWELVDLLPTGERLPVSPDHDLRDGPALGDRELDAVLTGLSREADDTLQMRIDDPENGRTLRQTCIGPFRECVVFTPPHRETIAIEPYTAAPTTFDLEARGFDAGLQVLDPGASTAMQIEIRFEEHTHDAVSEDDAP